MGFIDLEKLGKEQSRLAKRVVLKDEFKKPVKTIAGFDQAFFDEKIVSVAITFDFENMQIIEKQHVVVKAEIPYVPGFLSYREGPGIMEVYRKLKKKPNILMIDANGILHPKRIGMASHVGVLLNKATIGVAKSLLCGGVKNDRIYFNNELRGFVLHTKKKCKPIFISPGNKISLRTSLEIVKKCIRNYKLPEPLRLAHLYANEVKRKYGNNNSGRGPNET